jgi:hypothetical protein
MNAEQIIKEALDGLFFSYNCGTQQTRVRRVSKDYIPSHKPVGFYDDDAKPSTARKWTEAEDQMMIQMFERGFTFRQMGRALKASQSAANVRWQELCVKHGFSNKRRDLHQKFPAEVYARVAHLKAVECMTSEQIAKEMGFTLNQVAGIWRRWKRNNSTDELAA